MVLLAPSMPSSRLLPLSCGGSTERVVWDFSVTLYGPDEIRPYLQHIVQAVTGIASDDQCALHFQLVVVQPPQHLCGWFLLWTLFLRFGLEAPAISQAQLATLRTHRYAQWFPWIQARAQDEWAHCQDRILVAFAATALLAHVFIIAQNRIPDEYQQGGAGNSAPAAPSQAKPPASTALDPLVVHDPWARSATTPSKWEDLVLSKSHPFVDEHGTQLSQLHRLQATNLTGGIILTTKQFVSEIYKLNPQKPLILLLPQLDDFAKTNLGVPAFGPFEVILTDKAVGQTYKRVTHAVPVQGKFEFKLKDPSCEFTTSSISEVVIELDSRLCSKSEFEQANASPVHCFKEFLLKHQPSLKTDVTLYGYRHNRHPAATKGDDQLQIIAKVPTTARAALLTLSGADGFLIRDYIDQTKGAIDITVVPKFWDISTKSLREILITVDNLKGAAGITMTRRGLAVRAWAKSIAEVRRLLLPSDPRLTDANIGIVPRIMLDSSGWPAGASPADVVQAVQTAVGAAPVPTRMFRAAGVHVWQLGFESPPATDTFTMRINSALHQILLAPPSAPEKGRGKGKQGRKKSSSNKENPPNRPTTTAPSGPSPEKHRLEILEARFDTLQGQVAGIESKQTTLEGKLDDRFSEISNTLRQLVNLTQTARAHEPSGETPPPKHSRNS